MFWGVKNLVEEQLSRTVSCPSIDVRGLVAVKKFVEEELNRGVSRNRFGGVRDLVE